MAVLRIASGVGVTKILKVASSSQGPAGIVEKVRVNPGNYADKKQFNEYKYTDESYQEELERIRSKFTPLVLLCKENGVAMRIGTNHGSLSDRIMNRFGDSPEGMVESAWEFAAICQKMDFHNFVFSILKMKLHNPQEDLKPLLRIIKLIL